MKQKLLITCLCLAGWLMPLVAWADVEINEANYPDAKFRTILMELPEGKDGVFTDEEIAGLHTLYLYASDERTWYITSLKGIEYLTALEVLDFQSAGCLKELDLRKNKALYLLSIRFSLMTRLEISGLSSLKFLILESVNVEKLDLFGCTALEYLGCWRGKLEELKMQDCTLLKELYCRDNRLTSLDLTACPLLKELDCSSNQLKSLDVSVLPHLEKLNCSRNQLGHVDVSKNVSLNELWCTGCNLAALDVSGNELLRGLMCYGNHIVGTQMTALVNSMPTAPEGGQVMLCSGDSGEDNECTQEQAGIARGKNWIFISFYDIPIGGFWLASISDIVTPSGINAPSDYGSKSPADIYTLDGRRLATPPTKGVYIQNGRKVVIK
jgi:hypothetical protein